MLVIYHKLKEWRGWDDLSLKLTYHRLVKYYHINIYIISSNKQSEELLI